MRNLRLYSTDAAFKTHEQAAGGDGDSTVSIVPGVSMSKDIRKRYFNPADGSVAVYTLAAKYTKEGTEFNPRDVPSQIKVKYITGTTSQVNVNAPSAGLGLKPVEPFATATIPTDTAITFDYAYDKKELLGKYLTFEILSGGTIRWRSVSSSSTYKRTIQYRKNGGAWTSITSDTDSSAPSINVVAGDIVEFKGDNYSYSFNYMNCFSSSTPDLRFNAYGNIMSLIDSTDFKSLKTLISAYSPSAFTGLFSGCTSLVKANGLLLPATTLADSCYAFMFHGCTSLTAAPELPATTLVYSCYYHMFDGCTSLTTAPELPATTLAFYCYTDMFYGCTSLTTAPVLPATTLAQRCYDDMFRGCTNLTTAPAILPATTLEMSCYRCMFYDCTSLTTAPELPATTLASRCYEGMFQGCTNLTQAPALEATTLANNCYESMFQSCTGLTQSPELPAIALAERCYWGMFQGCTNLTQAPELPATTLASRCYEGMFQGCTSLTTAPELPATTLASNCYSTMFRDCTGLTTAPVLPATSLASSCYTNMFRYCLSLTTVPELPATSLTTYCYYNMFYGCSSLNHIKCLATNINEPHCTSAWVDGVASSGTFIKAASMSSWSTGINGIPTNWTVQDATV